MQAANKAAFFFLNVSGPSLLIHFAICLIEINDYKTKFSYIFLYAFLYNLDMYNASLF